MPVTFEPVEPDHTESVVPNRRERRNSGKQARTATSFAAHGRSGAVVSHRQYANRRRG
ncbi:hypothetical protein [Kutzneria albida]|uniref:Uncharacterized protein n=1 Tax=Kutzneria albida DSM 43870 TaxID=1449976 RepID=W5WHB9_9PSEU|nr:hypothetical protein [Kutzneria albida]AHI00002.1 hypothetical protein KALB_6642 [Kutzneria albida DSM 43870]